MPELPAGFTETPSLPAGFSEAPSGSPALPAGFSEKPNPADWQKRVTPTKTYNGFDSVQREGDSGIWYGRQQGNKGKPGWFDDKGNRLGDAPGATPGFMDRKVNEGLQYGREFAKNPVQAVVSKLGDSSEGMIPLPAQLTLPGRLAGMVKDVAPNSWVGRNADLFPRATQAGFVHGAINDVTGPVQTAAHVTGVGVPAADSMVQGTEDYFRNNHVQDRTGEGAGALAPFLVGAGAAETPSLLAKYLPGTVQQFPRIASLANWGLHGLLGGGIAAGVTPEADLNPSKPNDYRDRKIVEGATGTALGLALGAPGAYRGVMNPPIAYKGDPLSPNVLTRSTIEPPPADNIPGLQRLADQGDATAAQALQDVRITAAKKNGIPLTRADITQDPIARASEEGLGPKSTTFRATQAQKINKAVSNIETKAALPEGADASTTIQKDIQSTYNRNRATSRQNYADLNHDIQEADLARIQSGQQSGNVINTDSTVAEINRILTEETPRPGVTAELQRIKSQLIDPTKPLNFKTAKGLVSNTEGVARDLGMGSVASPADSNGARLLSNVTRALDESANTTATNLLGDASKVEAASRFHRDNVTPFHDPATGLPQILDGPYADKATKSLLQTASPEQIQALASRLGPEGQAALKLKILEAARTAGERGLDGTRGFQPGAWADFLAKHSGALSETMPAAELNDLQGMVHLAQSTKAGTVANPSEGSSMGRRILAGIAGHGMGGPVGTLAGAALESGVESGVAALRAPGKLAPTLLSDTPLDRVKAYAAKMAGASDATPLEKALAPGWNPKPTAKAQAILAEPPVWNEERALTHEYLSGKRPVTSIDTQAEFDALPDGAVYRDTNGKRAVKTNIPKRGSSEYHAKIDEYFKKGGK